MTADAEIPKGYKLTDVGVIPEDWEVATLNSLGFMKSGEGITSANIDQCSRYPCYGGNGLRGFTSSFTHDGHHALIGRQGALCGNVLGVEGKFFASEHAVVVTPLSRTHIRWLTFVLGEMRLNQYAESSAQPGLSVSKILSLRVACPPTKVEQEAIAEALSDADALIESLEQILAKKCQIKQGAMQELLPGKRRLPGFSGEWEVKRLGEICEIAMGRTPPRLIPEYWGRGHTWLSIADLRAKVVSESKEEITALAASAMQLIPRGTLLMSFKLSIGRLCFAGRDLYTNEAICSFKGLKANADFLYYVLGRTDFSLYGKQAVKGYTLNSESLKQVEVPFPAETEQSAIATLLSDMDAEIGALEVKLAKARRLKQGMMQDLLTGRIRLV